MIIIHIVSNVKKLTSLLLLSAFLLSGCAGMGRVESVKSYDHVQKEDAARKKEETGVPYKKRFTFLMAWNGIPVGSITAEIPEIIEYKGKKAYVVKLVTRSNKFLSKIYRVEDTYISYVDTEKIHSLWFEADRKEGRSIKHVIVEYDLDKQEATYTNLRDGSIKTCGIKKNVQDPLSAVCYFMTLPLKIGSKLDITVNLNEKNYNLFVQVEDLKIVKLPGIGEYSAYKIRPYAELNGERYEKGRGWMYVSAEDNRYPLYGVVLIPFGKVTATLKSVEQL